MVPKIRDLESELLHTEGFAPRQLRNPESQGRRNQHCNGWFIGSGASEGGRQIIGGDHIVSVTERPEQLSGDRLILVVN